MRNHIWYGTKDYMQWVPAPKLGLDASPQGWTASGVFLDGGGYSRKSTTTHRQYSPTWDLADRDRLRPLSDYRDGIYGDGYIYFCNPFTMDKNVCPAWWAAPMLAGSDAPILAGEARPQLVPSGASGLGYPVKSAVYTVDTTGKQLQDLPNFYTPIPPGYAAWVGVHGSYTGNARVTVLPWNGGVPSQAEAVGATALATDSTVRVTDKFSGHSGISLCISGKGSVTLTGIIVQILPISAVPAAGGFISGQGHSGLSYTDTYSLTQYSAARDKVGLSFQLKEVEGWQRRR